MPDCNTAVEFFSPSNLEEGIMKVFKLLTALVLTLFLAGNAWAGDDVDMSAASNAVTCLAQFYSAMAELPDINTGKTARLDCKKNMIFISNNREMLIKCIAGAKAGYDIARADQIIQSMRQKSATGLEYTTTLPRATWEAYYDETTKHRYVKINNDTYAEYTRKGCFFKNISSSQPRLAKSRYIHPIDEDSFFLYMKQSTEANQYLTLPFKEPHPIGWRLEKVLVSLD
jgi:hypothetical protein